MTYFPYTGQVVVNTAGMVSSVKLLSLKHKIPCNLSVVLDTYTENPRKWFVKVFEEPISEKNDIITTNKWKVCNFEISKKSKKITKWKKSKTKRKKKPSKQLNYNLSDEIYELKKPLKNSGVYVNFFKYQTYGPMILTQS